RKRDKVPQTVVDPADALGRGAVAGLDADAAAGVQPAPEDVVAAAGLLDAGEPGGQPHGVVTYLRRLDPGRKRGGAAQEWRKVRPDCDVLVDAIERKSIRAHTAGDVDRAVDQRAVVAASGVGRTAVERVAIHEPTGDVGQAGGAGADERRVG